MRYLTLILLFFALYACEGPKPKPVGPQSLDFRIDTIQKVATLAKGESYFDFFIEDLKIDTKNNALIQAINDSIQARLLSGNINFSGQVDSYQALFDSICAEYQRLLKSDYPPYSAWDLSQSIKVAHNGDGLFSLESTHGAFTGGAHPNVYSSSQLIRLNDGQYLNLDSIIKASKMSELLALGESFFRNEYRIGETASLNEEGFWFEEDRFRFPEVFTLDTAGLHFHYNTYDIAPYAMGHFFIDIPASYLHDFLKPQYLIVAHSEAAPES